MTAVLLLAAAINPAMVQSFRFEWPHVLASFAFWPMTNPATGETTPVLIPGWTLQYEMFFYLLFAIAMPAGRWSLAVLAAMFLTLVALGQAFAFGTALTFFTAPLILQFLMGVLLGRAFQSGLVPRGALRPGVLALLAAMTVLAAFALVMAPPLLPPGWSALQSGVLATLVVAGLVRMEADGRMPEWRWAVLAGDASYAIYLAHPAVLSATWQMWRLTDFPANPWMLGVSCVFAALAAGLFLHALVELPLRRRLRPLTQPRQG